MKVIDGGAVHLYSGSDECPHAPDNDPYWQESVVLYAWDTEQKVYVFLRLSQEPHRGDGFTTVWLNAWTPEFTYKHTDDSVPFVTGDRTETSLSSGHGLCRYAYDGKHQWSVNDGDVQIRLTMEDYHPGFGYWPASAGSLVEEAGRNHIEATGWTIGSVTVKGKTYEVAGTGWRDHSWGKRIWAGFRAHRFCSALFGRDFNLFALTFIGADGRMAKFGTLVRGDTIQATNDFSIIAYVGEDGVSNCGGRLTLRLDGETHLFEWALVGKSAISLHHGVPICDGMCDVTWGDKRGVGVFETSHRAQGGSEKPNIFPDSLGIMENGLYPATTTV
jgi:hypothetical protein